MEKPKLIIASDHAGYDLKQILSDSLSTEGYTLKDMGTNSTESCDYPDYAHALAREVQADKSSLGILICGSANGVSMAANKHNGVRAAIAWEPEVALLARTHNDANVISLPARFISTELAKEIVQAFLSSTFEGGRHARRADKIDIPSL